MSNQQLNHIPQNTRSQQCIHRYWFLQHPIRVTREHQLNEHSDNPKSSSQGYTEIYIGSIQEPS
jgi:hypothetical protein